MTTLEKGKRNLVLWVVAALIIIIVLYLVAVLFGTFTTGMLPSPCVANNGYLCESGFLSSVSGNITVILSQNTGKNWSNVYFVFVPLSTPINSSGIPEISFKQPDAVYNYSIPTGISSRYTLPATSPGIVKGSAISGNIWAKYMTNGTNQTSYAEMAALNIKAS